MTTWLITILFTFRLSYREFQQGDISTFDTISLLSSTVVLALLRRG